MSGEWTGSVEISSRTKSLAAGKACTAIFWLILQWFASKSTVWQSSVKYDGSHGLTFTWCGCRSLCLWHKLTELAHSFSCCSCVCFCLYGPFNCIPFHEFSRQLSAFSLCSSGLISAFLVLSTCLVMKVSLSPDVILCGWLGLKPQLTN